MGLHNKINLQKGVDTNGLDIDEIQDIHETMQHDEFFT